MSNQADVIAANEAFYEAFAARDIATMEALWAPGDDVACTHPGWGPLRSRQEVIDSWEAILGGDDAPEIQWADASAVIYGDMAFVVCNELLEGGVLTATDIFVRRDGGWKICHHHASPVMAPRPEAPTPPQVLN